MLNPVDGFRVCLIGLPKRPTCPVAVQEVVRLSSPHMNAAPAVLGSTSIPSIAAVTAGGAVLRQSSYAVKIGRPVGAGLELRALSNIWPAAVGSTSIL